MLSALSAWGRHMKGLALHGFGERLRPLVWGGAACLLLAPGLAMQLGADGVHWTAADFVVMGLLLAAACGLYELGMRLDRRLPYRLGFWLATLTGFLTIWVNLAVGMLGSEGHPANLMFAGVLAIAALGALLAWFRAPGMAKAMLAAAIAQALAVAVAVPMGFELRELVFTAMFALPWLGAAAMFHAAGRVDAASG